MSMTNIIWALAYLLLAPFIGGLLEGIDRKISARMQRRVGPPILQPFYDVKKLLNKQIIVVNPAQSFLMITYLLMMILTGVVFFLGMDLLMCFFILSTSAAFLYFAAMVTNSPYSTLGASRELVQTVAYEPAVLLAAVGLYLATGTFFISDMIKTPLSPIVKLPGVFIAFVFCLTIKLRKSPFDTSASRHPHQELVKGLTTEMGARNLAFYTIAEWYEITFLMGVIALFIVNKNLLSYIGVIVVVALVYFLEILVDNSSARMKWEKMLKMSWAITMVCAGVNIIILMLMK